MTNIQTNITEAKKGEELIGGITRNQAASALAITSTIAGAIRSLGSIPSGHLYAQLMGKLSLAQYESCIGLLVKIKLIKIENHLITWVGKEV
jgi:hypothetical protein